LTLLRISIFVGSHVDLLEHRSVRLPYFPGNRRAHGKARIAEEHQPVAMFRRADPRPRRSAGNVKSP